jgi:membrane-bound lytic murein transglycosylase A
MTHMPIRSATGHSSLAAFALVLMLGGCVSPNAPALARDRSPAALPGWTSDDLAGLAGAIDGQCSLARPPAPWPRLCPEFREHRANLRPWLERRFSAEALAGADGTTEGLITGYHEPEVTGSRARLAESQVPLYRRPSQAVLRERPSRARIEGSALLAGGELVWLDDPVDAFFLQVQGSGRIRLREGGTMRVGYAADNGQPYRAIGQVLIERGALAPANVDAGTIKAWLRANPREARSVMHANPRYIFFRELPPAGTETGPPGSLGVPLTPMRSVAVDPARVPAGSLLFLDTTDPLDTAPLRRVVVAQDTGAAIVGPVRADLFWGNGSRAELAAGRMKQRGRLWRLVPRD